MSIKKEYEVKTRTVTERVCVKETMHCDVCNGVIEGQENYWELTTGHHDWGNDSLDSIECFDVCSEVCLREKFDEYVRESRKNSWNTMYFEVSKS
jgi:hypothetical protein